jgi:hypothetical protein
LGIKVQAMLSIHINNVHPGRLSATKSSRVPYCTLDYLQVNETRFNRPSIWWNASSFISLLEWESVGSSTDQYRCVVLELPILIGESNSKFKEPSHSKALVSVCLLLRNCLDTLC